MFAKFLTSTAVALALTVSLGVSSHAADKKAEDKAKMEAMMAKAKAAGTPGAGHEVLKPLAGNWTATSRHWMPGEKKPQDSAGTSSFTWVLDGRFLRQDFKGNWAGQPFEGLGFLGYDNVKKEYVSTWMDSMSTGIGQATGQWDAAAKTITDQGSFSCPLTEKTMTFRAEWKFVDKDNVIYSMFMKDEAGKETKAMEIKYKRAK
ncbi:MAG TPA: DUF1579 domain-containing protein [bacterium]|nr:DUF1579 domain-containing protein [bacterium]